MGGGMASSDAPVDISLVGPRELDGDRALWDLYETAFPSTEREPAGVIRATVALGNGFVLRATAAGATIGFAVSHVLRDPPVNFLVYLVVHPAWRAQGVGSELFERTFQEGVARNTALAGAAEGLIWEVDDPAEASSPHEQARRSRRIAFFTGVGGRVLPLRYRQPAVDGTAPVPMLLMFRSTADHSWPDTARTARIVRAMYMEKYHGVNGLPRESLQQLLDSTSM